MYASVPLATPSAAAADRAELTDSSTDSEQLMDTSMSVNSSLPPPTAPVAAPKAAAHGQWSTQLGIAALSAISGFLFGYDLCVMVVALPLIQAVRCPYEMAIHCFTCHGGLTMRDTCRMQHFELSTAHAESVVSVLMLGAVAGSLIGGVGSDWYVPVSRFTAHDDCADGLTRVTVMVLTMASSIGRKPAIVVTAIFFLLGSLFMTLAGSLAAMLVGRFLAGLAVGASGPCVSAYLSEIAHPDRRGTLVTLNEVMLCVGCLVSVVVSGLLQNTKVLAAHGECVMGMEISPSVRFALCPAGRMARHPRCHPRSSGHPVGTIDERCRGD